MWNINIGVSLFSSTMRCCLLNNKTSWCWLQLVLRAFFFLPTMNYECSLFTHTHTLGIWSNVGLIVVPLLDFIVLIVRKFTRALSEFLFFLLHGQYYGVKFLSSTDYFFTMSVNCHWKVYVEISVRLGQIVFCFNLCVCKSSHAAGI